MNEKERAARLAELEAQRLAARARAEASRERQLLLLERWRKLIERAR